VKRHVSKLLLIALLACFLIVSFSSLVKAAPSTSNIGTNVQTYDALGNVRDEFLVGEKIRIRADLFFYYVVRVFDPDGHLVYEQGILMGPFDSGLLDNISTKHGTWNIEVNSLLLPFQIRGEFLVIPIGPLGTVGMFALFLAAFGMKSLNTKRKANKP
jgi:hypothetical protein